MIFLFQFVAAKFISARTCIIEINKLEDYPYNVIYWVCVYNSTPDQCFFVTNTSKINENWMRCLSNILENFFFIYYNSGKWTRKHFSFKGPISFRWYMQNPESGNETSIPYKTTFYRKKFIISNVFEIFKGEFQVNVLISDRWILHT